MRNRSETWKRLAVRGEFTTETVAVINNTTYSTITAPIIERCTLPGNVLSVGNCAVGALKFTIMTADTIPRAAQVEIKSRIVGVLSGDTEPTSSEWMTMGKFWIDKRTVKDNDLTYLECFDSMMKGYQGYSDNSQAVVWPKPMQTVVARCAEQMGVEIDSRTVIKTGNDYVCTKPDDDMTLLDILGHIGAVHGGNWIITPENKLRLVQIVSPPSESFYIIDEEYNIINTPEGDRLVWQHGGSLSNVNPSGGGLINVPVVLGDVTTARSYTVSRVTISVDSDTWYTAGNDTGFEIKIEQNPYATQALCNALYTDISGTTYSPYTVTRACYDPATEIGDWIVIGDLVRSVIYNESLKFDITYQADTSAPGEDELDSEYPYQPVLKKTQYTLQDLKKSDTVIKTEIRQTQESITAEYTRATTAEATLSGDIDDEETRAKNAESNLSADISTETSRATRVEESLSSRLTIAEGAITAEVTRATAAETTLTGSIGDEETRAKAIEESLASRLTIAEGGITAEVTRATTAETTITNNLTGETTRATNEESRLSGLIAVNAGNIELKVAKDDVIASINASAETSGGSTLTINANKLNLQGYATFSALQTDGGASIHGGNVTNGTLDDDAFNSATKAALVGSSTSKMQYYLSTSSSTTQGGQWKDTTDGWTANHYVWTRIATTVTKADGTTTDTQYSTAVYDINLTTALSTASTASTAAGDAQTAANSATARSQTIYKSVANITINVPAYETWVTESGNVQNTWTTTRPEYSQSYPILYTAQQRQSVSQFNGGTGTTCSCTPPVHDQTTTVIDGNNIITGTINAGKIYGGTIDGNTVNAKQLQIVDGNNNVVASFNNVITLGDASDIHAEFDFNSLEIKDANGNAFVHMGDIRNENGLFERTDSFTANSIFTRFALTYNTSSKSNIEYVTINGNQISSDNYDIEILPDPYPLTRVIIPSAHLSVGDSVVIKYQADEPIYRYDFGQRSASYRIGNGSYCEGYQNAAIGAYSHAEGAKTYAYNTSHAEGANTTASGSQSHAEGSGTTASGSHSHAEGYKTIASGYQSHAEGSGTTASGSHSHAEGYKTIASGGWSYAGGCETIASEDYQRVVGRYNAPVSNAIVIVGGGIETYRSNLMYLTVGGVMWVSNSYTNASDQRLKTECGEVPDVSDIKARLFKWNDKKLNHDDKEHIGYFAQDVEEVAPYLVDEDAMGYKSLDYNGILVAKIASLERRVAELEKLVGGLNGR